MMVVRENETWLLVLARSTPRAVAAEMLPASLPEGAIEAIKRRVADAHPSKPS